MSWTEEEIAALPQTDTVFDQPKLVVNEHEWLQSGYMMTDNCSPARMNCINAGIPLPNGKMIVKEKGAYKIVDEMRK